MEFRFVLVGHVDAGKSTLGGHILKFTEAITPEEFKSVESEAEQQNKSKQKFSFILDTDNIERERGKTADFTQREFNYKNKKFVLIDTPGHRQFVRCMVEGSTAGRIDAGVCLISVKTGEFEAGLKGQTLEHLTILRGLGLKQLVVAINKTDYLDPANKTERLKEIYDRLSLELKKLGYKDVQYVEISAWTGVGIDKLLDILNDFKMVSEPEVIATSDKLRFKGIFTNTSQKTVKSAGYKCILHTLGKTIEAEITKIESSNKKPFVIEGMALADIELKQEVTLGKNIILRNGDETIAIGLYHL